LSISHFTLKNTQPIAVAATLIDVRQLFTFHFSALCLLPFAFLYSGHFNQQNNQKQTPYFTCCIYPKIRETSEISV
jgi:hypothetical protein